MTSLRLPLSALCAVLLLGLASGAQAQWKWRDADGRVQYSDRAPPPGVQEKDILSRPSGATLRAAAQAAAPGASAPASAASGPMRAASGPSSRDRVEQERKAAEDKLRADTDAENCRQAQTRIRVLESGVRLRAQNDKGESQPMDEAARREQLRQAQTIASASCK